MSIRRYPEPYGHQEYPVVGPVEAGDIDAIVEEFMARHTDRPHLTKLANDNSEAKGVLFTLGPDEEASIFSLHICCKYTCFSCGVDFDLAAGRRSALKSLFKQLNPGVAFGGLETTDDGVQWQWVAPSLHYPYFHGIAAHAVAYAEYLSERLWPVVRQVADSTLSVTAAYHAIESDMN